jgi:hypothetical protein
MFLYPFVFCILFVLFVNLFVKYQFVCKMFVKIVPAGQFLLSFQMKFSTHFTLQATNLTKKPKNQKHQLVQICIFVFL